ncbi:MAG: cytochrome c oxidase subunit 3 [SAR324 cluster bacterium]|nr:cytochrome c oxidase subunit 3 [SAR324 cluster bacterium]
MSSEGLKINPRKPAIPNGVVGMLFFVASEVMFFAALVSAYMILRAGVPVWPPWGQPRLPVTATAFNSLVLFASGFLLILAGKQFAMDKAGYKKTYILSLAAGAFFVIFQGYEWVGLINFGLTMTSSNYGGLFYLIIGTHAFHAVAALVCLVWLYPKFDTVEKESVQASLTTVKIFWLFVVGLWPVLYTTVYLL